MTDLVLQAKSANERSSMAKRIMKLLPAALKLQGVDRLPTKEVGRLIIKKRLSDDRRYVAVQSALHELLEEGALEFYHQPAGWGLPK